MNLTHQRACVDHLFVQGAFPLESLDYGFDSESHWSFFRTLTDAETPSGSTIERLQWNSASKHPDQLQQGDIKKPNRIRNSVDTGSSPAAEGRFFLSLALCTTSGGIPWHFLRRRRLSSVVMPLPPPPIPTARVRFWVETSAVQRPVIYWQIWSTPRSLKTRTGIGQRGPRCWIRTITDYASRTSPWPNCMGSFLGWNSCAVVSP